MITYEVTATAADAETAERYERYMTGRHLRDVLATGCFVDATLERAGSTKFRVRYRARSEEHLDRYMEHHTAALRQDFASRFPTGVQLARETWREVAVLTPA